MRHLNEFVSEDGLNESLEKAKSYLEKELKDFTQGFEIYIDDSGKKDQLIISVDELIQGGAEYPDLDKAINKAINKFRLNKDRDSNDQVVFLTEGVSNMKPRQVYGKLSILLTKYKSENAAYKDSAKLAKKLGYTQDAVEAGIDYYFNSDNYDDYFEPGEEMKSMMESDISEKAGMMFSILKSKLRDAAKLIKDPSDKEEFYNMVKDFIQDKTGIEVMEDYKDLHERADSKAQRRLFAIALQFKRGNIKESDLEEEYAEEIIKISKLPEETLRKFAKTKEKGLPHYVGEGVNPLSFVNKRRAKAEVKQFVKGKRSDGMGAYDAVIIGIDKQGKQGQIKNLNQVDYYTQWALADPSYLDSKEFNESINESVFGFTKDPLTFPNYMHGYKGTNHMAKAELTKWWNSLGLTAEQQEQAMENLLKVQHHLYTQFYLGNPGRAWAI